MKDNFSGHAHQYAQFRPDYPDKLIRNLMCLVRDRENAWDCATGNGQMALKLAPYFKNVYATDISNNQLANASAAANIHYKQEAAESTSFPDEFFDLIMVAQAIHWFDFDRFYHEVHRTLKSNGIFAVVGYGLISANPIIDAVIKGFYTDIVGPYWDPERKYIDDAYRTIPFPFKEIPFPALKIKKQWDIGQLEGYLNTWSATHHYVKAYGTNPVSAIMPLLKSAWQQPVLDIEFPLLCRIGRKNS